MAKRPPAMVGELQAANRSHQEQASTADYLLDRFGELLARAQHTALPVEVHGPAVHVSGDMAGSQ